MTLFKFISKTVDYISGLNTLLTLLLLSLQILIKSNINDSCILKGNWDLCRFLVIFYVLNLSWGIRHIFSVILHQKVTEHTTIISAMSIISAQLGRYQIEILANTKFTHSRISKGVPKPSKKFEI